jgi:guanyl-specific ribonuclease Sa
VVTFHLRSGLLLMIVCLLAPFSSLAAVSAATTTASGLTYTYDEQRAARVDAQALGATDAGLAQLSGARDGSAPLAVDSQGTSTTPHARSVATNTGRAALNLSDDVAAQVDDAVARVSQGQIRFPGHDGKPYLNRDGLLPARSDYTEWTAAASGAKRGADRVIIAGNPARPEAIYYWDHVNPPVRIGP